MRPTQAKDWLCSVSLATTSAVRNPEAWMKSRASVPTYGADFELFDKVNAKGSTTEPYTTLNQMDPAGDVEWNFEKFLVGKNGTVIARFKSGVTPEDLKSAIEEALTA